MPQISVVIPVYNAEKYLSACLDSVLNQTFTDYEIICINDGSPDNCASILEEYANRYAKIKVITQQNKGVSITRNIGISKATGKYIYFVDSDDIIHPQLLETAFYYAEHFNTDIVSFNLEERVYNQTETAPFDIKDISYKIADNPILSLPFSGPHRIHHSVCTRLCKKSLFQKNSFIPNIHFEDFPYTYVLLSHLPRTITLDKTLYFYTNNSKSISRQKTTPQDIKNYHIGIIHIYQTYLEANLQAELERLIRYFIPNILKQQLARCKKAPKEAQNAVYKTFSEELKDLNQKNLLRFQGHKFYKYLFYRWLMLTK